MTGCPSARPPILGIVILLGMIGMLLVFYVSSSLGINYIGYLIISSFFSLSKDFISCYISISIFLYTKLLLSYAHTHTQ